MVAIGSYITHIVNTWDISARGTCRSFLYRVPGRTEQEHAKNSVCFENWFVTAVSVIKVVCEIVKRSVSLILREISGQSKQQQDSEKARGIGVEETVICKASFLDVAV